MHWSLVKTVIVGIVVLVILSVGLLTFVIWQSESPIVVEVRPPEIPTPSESKYQIIGRSVGNRPIEVYTYGNGGTRLIFVGGVHGGYEWNSVSLAYQLIDYLNKNPEIIPTNLEVAVIPDLNPDGVFAVTAKEGRFSPDDVSTDQATLAAGRFNANKVDLNRNFDCQWQATSTWQKRKVSGGTAAFSEPETAAFRDFISKYKPAGVVFWHSQSNAVYGSACRANILPRTLQMMTTYAQAAGYPAIKTFDSYQTSGAADDWLASINIPAITVELKTHETIEWKRNLAGIKALLAYYARSN